MFICYYTSWYYTASELIAPTVTFFAHQEISDLRIHDLVQQVMSVLQVPQCDETVL